MSLRRFSSVSKKLLEVEQKFTYLPRLLPALEANQGRPPFKSLAFLHASKFRDTYFDDDMGTLFKKRIYVRKRDDAWELKMKVTPGSSSSANKENDASSGDNGYDRVTYDEISDTDTILRILSKHLASVKPAPQANFGLKSFCDYVTSRRVFKADEKFSIMLDETNFRHSAGEIELMVPEEEADGARKEIEVFMEQYKWFFKPLGNITDDMGRPIEPKGKMSAYFEKFGMPFKS